MRSRGARLEVFEIPQVASFGLPVQSTVAAPLEPTPIFLPVPPALGLRYCGPGSQERLREADNSEPATLGAQKQNERSWEVVTIQRRQDPQESVAAMEVPEEQSQAKTDSHGPASAALPEIEVTLDSFQAAASLLGCRSHEAGHHAAFRDKEVRAVAIRGTQIPIEFQSFGFGSQNKLTDVQNRPDSSIAPSHKKDLATDPLQTLPAQTSVAQPQDP